ncbi:hypothetical protein N7448_004277 [Penicillium atrosanguineum]|uniref:Putative peptidase domain-containing protein n=1 Tax=Penicillium atrosanguineum TaxID=1132637 RepID=A0A9W9HAR9_9EURO|nr:uncharacterized protein N7443_003242 [Penicillium atrosanguineum]KAJ5118076.1 hypothetical protein N7526_011099 [Penicillium atrosanguineum]KAJ5140869.1 hypothetical protein N7448_004277 [Penicillium atrosanguineum]KAJ5310781.1 hypothetical protein N7443_003242 [Penicillium atrosanguineum]KAJ5316305.1 hypothetical protein N7476_006612 [Penicillium atrosanguineum]
MIIFRLSLFYAAFAAALPAPGRIGENMSQPFSQAEVTPWNAGAVTEFAIHSSCNATQRRQINLGLNEAVSLAMHAKSHILRWGNNSDIYRKYFGNSPSMNAIGAFDIVVNGDKKDVLFRCDNPDGNCDLQGYAGHWRGKNATDETVICDLSYETRRSLSTMCALGYTVSGSETNTFWASDLLHRLYHVPAVGQDWIGHFADGYEEVVDLATTNATLSTHDSETLQYFALEAYAYDIAVPGTGCPGNQQKHHGSDLAEPDASANQTSSTSTASELSSTTSDAPAHCHTHAGGELHCT